MHWRAAGFPVPCDRGLDVRFDDSLKTVLSADMATGFGAQSAWRQLVDLMGRGRVTVDEPAIARLRLLRQAVPASVRAASARALAFAAPGVDLVGFFAEDELAIAAPVLRLVTLPARDWLALLPRLTPTGRSVLRHRRDLPPEVLRGLQSFGATDFVLPQPAHVPADAPAAVEAPAVAPVIEEVAAPVAPPEPEPVAAPRSDTPFMALGDIARGLPVVAQAFRHIAAERSSDPSRFEISDLVARIEAFNRDRVVPDAAPPVAPAADVQSFRFETDAAGVIRWVEGVSRSALIGVSLAYAALQGEAQVDGVAAGGFRRRSRFSDARLQVGGMSDAAGSWRISAIPAFDHASGRFTGMRGTARRPRRDEVAERQAGSPVSDSLRQLVHELRTPTNAIAGFAELIETQLLGPVSPTYRDRAVSIRTQAADLLAAIDDLDTAARIEGHALDLRPTIVPVLPLLERVTRDLAPLATLRGATLLVDPASPATDIAGDDRAVERLVGRLLAALVSACGQGERIAVTAERTGGQVSLGFDRPRALAAQTTDTLFSIDAEEDQDGAPLLGTGFTLRLVQNLAGELGGSLAIAADRLTLRLPAALDGEMGQAFDILR